MANQPSFPTSAPFNMAIDTLMRLGDILRDIKIYSARVDMTLEDRQAMKIGLIRQFFFQSCPLISNEEFINKYKEIILKLNPKQRPLYISRGKLPPKFIGMKNIFDPNLENIMDVILVDIERELQKEKYFMPPKSDPRYSWSQER